MKFNEQQNEALEELYRIARGYVNLAKVINDAADEIKNSSTDTTVDEYLRLLFVVAKTAYIKEIAETCNMDDTKCLKYTLNNLIEAFKKD